MSQGVDERLLLTSFKFVRQKQYWQNKLSNITDIAGVKILYENENREKPGAQTTENKQTVQISVPGETCSRIMKLGNESHLTIYIILLAALKVLLHRYSGLKDLVVFSPVYEPNVAEDTLNHLLAIRENIEEEMTFKELLVQVSRSVQDAYANQDYPFNELLQSLLKNDQVQGNGFLSNVACYLGTIHDPESIEKLANKDKIIFGFDFERNQKQINGTIFAPRSYAKHYIEQVSRHYTNILAAVLNDINIKISEIFFLSEREKKQLLYDFNETEREYPKDRLIHELFEEQVKRVPDHVALLGKEEEGKGRRVEGKKEGMHLTYEELNKKSNQLAYVLIERGVEPDTIVGIMIERSIEMIVGMLAILKAGGAYLPIDPEYPVERINYMLTDSGAKILLSAGHHPDLPSSPLPSFSHLHLSPAPVTSLAYIIYTSGSTGKPKGVLIEHLSVVNMIVSRIGRFKISKNERILQFSSICFDASVEQIFIALLSGAILILVDKDTLLSSSEFGEFMLKQSVTHLDTVPSFINNMEIKGAKPLRRIISGGEVCPVSLAKKWSQYCDFYNEYGPTETTVISIEILVKNVDETSIGLPIGRPINNTFVYLFDKWMKLVPLGAAGELHIGGAGLARGYLNRPDLTSEKFVHGLWDYQEEKQKKGTGSRYYKSYIYKTGDLARWKFDGTLELLGRIDHQVKIRGYRIELGEIEHRLLSHEHIKQVVVTAHTPTADAGSHSGIRGNPQWENKTLCAYFVPGEKIDIKELKEWLSMQLPQYMVPTYFIPLQTFPLSPNGKIDIKALPDPEKIAAEQEVSSTYGAPGTYLEKIIANTWREVLNLEKVGVNDNFFNIGGNSLEIGRLATKLGEALNREIEFITLFQYPTIRELARYLGSGESEENPEPVEIVRTDEIKQAQHRLKQRIRKSKEVKIS